MSQTHTGYIIIIIYNYHYIYKAGGFTCNQDFSLLVLEGTYNSETVLNCMISVIRYFPV